MKLSLTIFLLFIGFAACTYNSEEELYPNPECQILNMSYVDDVLPILETHCFPCHSRAANFGNITLEGYDNLIDFVDDQSLLGSIQHESGYSAMPQGQAMLIECNIEKIKSWINDGAPEN